MQHAADESPSAFNTTSHLAFSMGYEADEDFHLAVAQTMTGNFEIASVVMTIWGQRPREDVVGIYLQHLNYTFMNM